MKFVEPMMLALIAGGFAALAGSISVPSTSYAHRNGADEALNDIAAGRPPKLYWHAKYIIGPASSTPGLYCPKPERLKAERVEIPEAVWSEGRTSWEALRQGEEARAFAYLYNMAMYQAHKGEWHRACPRLTVYPYQPILR